jgi:putative Ca2+/H+ antiporter (TMEM165/GDT1 family)
MSVPALAPLLEWTTVAGASFGRIFLAEMADKSQLVCMTFVTRHRHWSVLAGSIAAFLFPKTLAVVFGAGVARRLPERLLVALVAVLFGVFGVLALRAGPEREEANLADRSSQAVFLTTFALLFLNEIGDNTHLAVAGLAGTQPPLPL